MLKSYLKRCFLSYGPGSISYNAELPSTAVLSYDDGPSDYTIALLDALKRNGVNATFFVLINNVLKKPAIIQRIYSEGHEVGIHGYDHVNFGELSIENACNELKSALRVIMSEIGIPREAIQSFRPPWGYPWRLKTFYKIKPMQRVLDDLSLHLTLWSYDPKDLDIHAGKARVEDVSKRIIREFNGGVVLLHDIHDSVVNLTNTIIDAGMKKGITFITAAEWRAALLKRQGNKKRVG